MPDIYKEISPGLIYPNPHNPRKTFEPEAMAELVENIKQHGVIQPLVVVADTEKEPHMWRLVCGERRWRAAVDAGLDLVPVVVKDYTPEQELEAMIIENWQRKDVNPVEEAKGLKTLLDAGGYTQEELAKKIGCSQAQIANRLRLLELPDSVKENISRGIISAGAAKELLACKKAGPAVIEAVAEKAAEEGMTVKEVARAVAREVWNASRCLTPPPAHQPGLGGPKFDTDGCEKCKKKTMLKYPWSDDREELRCLKPACWDAKQKEAQQAAQEEQEAELFEKYPDAILIDDLPEAVRHSNVWFGDYCRAKECEHYKLGRWRGIDGTRHICLAPDSFAACEKDYEAGQREARDRKAKEKKQTESSAEAEIEQLVNKKLDGMTFADVGKDALIYIAGAMLGGFEYPVHCDVFEYLERVAGPLPGDWEDGLPCDAEGWPHLLGVLKNLSEAQLIRIIFEWPALALGMETAGMVEWFLKGVPASEKEPARKISNRVGWILNNSCGDINYNTNIPLLTDEELIYCLEHEDRTSGMQKLLREAKKRGMDKKPSPKTEADVGAGPGGRYRCGTCDIGHWYSGEYTYTQHMVSNGDAVEKRPCEPHTHYCCDFLDFKRKIAPDREFNPDIAPDWCPRSECAEEDPDGHGTCRVCGCTDDAACPGGCYWVEPDLCSRCAGENIQEPEPEPAPELRRYLDTKGREFFVSADGEEEYGTFWKSHRFGGHYRMESPAMPMVASQAEAQANLDAWAVKNGLQPVPEKQEGVA
ncbi:chromosome partitioning protein ParB [Desulfocucumis palustris]|uniref:Chromosome partitioning protein ParB n=1 Tax=Desulfocucumis palustris TaxID=1898651 RepID=A0A2L2XH21_9FIRM|nr:ParB/RepB/Spo0J family partition protein [Desulfocucumis palustris]GBF35432.1 chromosome partitioning protein ParB [Desulfocucumis palustris]